MKKVKNLASKRPHILPPLPDVHPLMFRRTNSLQPPDLITENRLGSPVPRQHTPEVLINNGNDGTPAIRIFEVGQKENTKLDLLSNIPDLEQPKSTNLYSPREIENSFHDIEIFKRNDLGKKLKSLKPLTANLNSESNTLNILSRYTPLKPIGQH